MTKQEKEQLEALEMYLLHAGQSANDKMLKATNGLNAEFYKGRSGAFTECEYLLKDFLELGRLDLPGKEAGVHGYQDDQVSNGEGTGRR